jgi:hypothetical protein
MPSGALLLPLFHGLQTAYVAYDCGLTYATMTCMTMTRHAAGDLVQLRALLDQALAAVRSDAPLARVTAVVLLDAVNERAMHIAAGAAGAHLSENDKFEQSFNKLSAALGTKWSRDGWGDVRRLHRSRNLAQHEGMPPDRDSVAGWAAATETFASAVVEAACGVQLNDLVLSDALRDPDASSAFRRGEEALRERQPEQAFDAAVEAFNVGRLKWLRQKPLHGYRSKPFRLDVIDSGVWEYIEQELEALQDLAIVGAFVADPGDYLWFSDMMRSRRQVTPTVDEAQRALSFVFWWLVRWEAFSQSYIPDRRAHELRQRREIRPANHRGPASISDVAVRHLWEDRWEVRLRLRDLPAEPEFGAWQEHVAARLREVADHPYVEEDGVLVLQIPASADHDAVRAAIESALRDAEQDVVDRQLAAQHARVAREAEAAQYAQGLLALPGLLPTWITEAKLDTDQGVISGGIRQSRLRLTLSQQAQDAAGEVAALLREVDVVQQCYQGGGRTLHIEPELGPVSVLMR